MLMLLLFVIAASVLGLAAHRATIAVGRRFGMSSREVSGWKTALPRTLAGAVVGFGVVLILLMLLNRN